MKGSWVASARAGPPPQAVSVPCLPHLQLCDAHLVVDPLLIPPLVLGHRDVGQLYLQLQHLLHLLPRGGWMSSQQHSQLLHVVQVGGKHLSRPQVILRAQQQVLPKAKMTILAATPAHHLFCRPSSLSRLQTLLVEAFLDDPHHFCHTAYHHLLGSFFIYLCNCSSSVSPRRR